MIVFLKLLFIGIVIIFGYAFISTMKDENNRKHGIIYQEYGATFLGGFPDVEGNRMIEITLTKDSLELNINGREKSIPVHCITNAEIKTNQQIANEVSVGKLLVFGIFALGMKNEKTIVKNYTDITFDDNSIKRYIILECKDNEKLVKQLRCLIKL